MCSWIACRFCLPSSRLIVIVNGLNAPACDVRSCPPSATARTAAPRPGQGLPFGPEVISNVEDASTGSLPDHGVNDAFVV